MLDFDDKETVEEAVEEEEKKPQETKRTSKKSNNRVTSMWPRVINGQMLLESSGDYRLQPEAEWSGERSFLLDSDKFYGLPEPESFDIGGLDNEYLWKAGVVSRNQGFAESAIQQALHYSQSRLSVSDVTAMIKVN